MSINIQQTVQNWLAQRQQRQIIVQATLRAYTAFSEQYPEWAAALFDQYFVTQQVAPRLIDNPEPTELAQLWVEQISWSNPEKKQKLVAELTPVVCDFLRLVANQLPDGQFVGKLALYTT
jgi:hypothetical protein